MYVPARCCLVTVVTSSAYHEPLYTDDVPDAFALEYPGLLFHVIPPDVQLEVTLYAFIAVLVPPQSFSFIMTFVTLDALMFVGSVNLMYDL